jgi:hypothetical protein
VVHSCEARPCGSLVRGEAMWFTRARRGHVVHSCEARPCGSLVLCEAMWFTRARRGHVVHSCEARPCGSLVRGNAMETMFTFRPVFWPNMVVITRLQMR